MKYAQEQENTGFFSKVTTVLPPLAHVGATLRVCSESGEPYRDRILGQTPLDWQDRLIIPDQMLTASHRFQLTALPIVGFNLAPE